MGRKALLKETQHARQNQRAKRLVREKNWKREEIHSKYGRKRTEMRQNKLDESSEVGGQKLRKQ